MTESPPERAAAELLQELKAQGNAAFAQGSFEEALGWYTEAIETQDKFSDADYDSMEAAKAHSNRSACLYNLGRYDEAIADGHRCTELAPTWPKGYFRAAEGCT